MAYPCAVATPCLRTMWLSGNAERKPGRPPAPATCGLGPARQPASRRARHARTDRRNRWRIGARDAVAAGCLRPWPQQRDGRGSRTSCRRARPSPAGLARRSPRRRRRRRRRSRPASTRAERRPRRSAGPRLPAAARQRRAQQHDAEVGVGARHREVAATAPDAACRPARRIGEERRRGRVGAARNVARLHAVARGENVDVARLRRLELGTAGRDEGGGDSFRRRGHAVAPRSVRAGERGEQDRRRASGRCRSARPSAAPARPACC